MKRIKIGHLAIVVLVGYLIYVLCFAFFPYFGKKKVSENFEREVQSYDFYSDSPCIDRVALVEDPSGSLDTRLYLLNQASHTIDIAYYALHMGETTDQFLSAIQDAADRGVKVRFLLDGMFCGFSNEYKHLAEALGSHENIEMRLYNPVNFLKPWTFNGRMHDKYIIIDNKYLLLGGRNIGDKYFAPDDFKKNLSIDRDVLVYNTDENPESRKSVLFQVRDYMDTVWNYKSTKTAYNKKNDKSEQQRARLLEVNRKLKKENQELFTTPLDFYRITYPANKITFFANDIGIMKKEPKVGYIIRELVMGAKDHVLLQSPYIVLSENIEAALEKLGQTNIPYEILTNSMQSSPNLPAYSLYMNDRKKILESGAKIYEFQNTDAIHAKTYIIDDRMSIVGAFNMDPRSEYIDTETMITIDSEEFTDHLENVLSMYKDHSLVVDENGEYIPDDTVPYYPDSKVKRILFRIVGFLLRPFRILI